MSFWSPEYSGSHQEGEETERAFLQAETRATLTNIYFFLHFSLVFLLCGFILASFSNKVGQEKKTDSYVRAGKSSVPTNKNDNWRSSGPSGTQPVYRRGKPCVLVTGLSGRSGPCSPTHPQPRAYVTVVPKLQEVYGRGEMGLVILISDFMPS